MAFDAGAIIARIGVDESGLTSGLQRASTAVQVFAGTFAASIATGIVDKIGGALVSFGQMVVGQAEVIDATGKLSDRLGIQTEALVGLQHQARLAGVGSEELAQSLGLMLNVIGDATTKGGEAAAALRSVGISSEQLRGMNTEQAFTAIAEGIAQLPDASLRASAAMNVFGKSGQRLLPMLMEGADGIKAARAEAERLGITFSRVDAAKVEQANDALEKVREVFEGLARTAVIELAPYVSALADEFTAMATAGGGAGKWIVAAVESVAIAVAVAADTLNVFKLGWNFLQVAALGVVLGIELALEGLIRAIDYAYSLITGKSMDMVGAMVVMRRDIEQSIAKNAQETLDVWGDVASGKNQNAVSGFFDEVKRKADEAAQQVAAKGDKMRAPFKGLYEDTSKAAEAIEKMRADVATFGMSEGQKAIFEFKALKHDDTQAAEFERLAKQKDALELGKKQDERVADMLKDALSPLEKFEKAVKEFADLQAAGKLSADQVESLTAKAREDAFGKQQNSRDTDLQAKYWASGQGATAVWDVQVQALADQRKNDLQKKQLDEAKTQSQYLASLDRKFDLAEA